MQVSQSFVLNIARGRGHDEGPHRSKVEQRDIGSVSIWKQKVSVTRRCMDQEDQIVEELEDFDTVTCGCVLGLRPYNGGRGIFVEDPKK